MVSTPQKPPHSGEIWRFARARSPSFTLDYRNVAAGGLPQSFNWLVFAAGLILGTAAYAKAAVRRRTVAGAVMESARASIAD
jgi:hypothetical protein